jgi:GMP synthase-like glutamine amidotransferase
VTAARILVVQNDPTDDIRRLGGWLTDAGAELITARPYAGEALPDDLTGFDALVVLGGAQNAYPVDGLPGAPWFPELETLLRAAVAGGVPTLGVCLGGQLLAQACGGRVERADNGPVFGPRLVAKRDIAEKDALFGPVPFTPDVYQWHSDEITLLPPGAVLMAAAPSGTIEAFRVGQRAWGTQFHIECDLDLVRTWADRNPARLAELGIDREVLLQRAEAALDDVEDVWRPFAERFVALCTGKISSMFLPVIEA